MFQSPRLGTFFKSTNLSCSLFPYLVCLKTGATLTVSSSPLAIRALYWLEASTKEFRDAWRILDPFTCHAATSWGDCTMARCWFLGFLEDFLGLMARRDNEEEAVLRRKVWLDG